MSRAGSTKRGSATLPSALVERIRSLTDLDKPTLRDQWQELHDMPPPRALSKDLLIRGIAYRIQEKALGGLSKTTLRKLQTLAERFRAGDAVDQPISLKPGARLIREWRGVTHTVQVVEDGYTYREQHYASLSRVAKAITGTHWSGPRFFGLKKPNRLTGSRHE